VPARWAVHSPLTARPGGEGERSVLFDVGDVACQAQSDNVWFDTDQDKAGGGTYKQRRLVQSELAKRRWALQRYLYDPRVDDGLDADPARKDRRTVSAGR